MNNGKNQYGDHESMLSVCSDLGLTPKEVEVMELLSDDISNDEIANTMGISVKTVKNHLVSIFRKLKVRNRNEAKVKFRDEKWDGLDDIIKDLFWQSAWIVNGQDIPEIWDYENNFAWEEGDTVPGYRIGLKSRNCYTLTRCPKCGRMNWKRSSKDGVLKGNDLCPIHAPGRAANG